MCPWPGFAEGREPSQYDLAQFIIFDSINSYIINLNIIYMKIFFKNHSDSFSFHISKYVENEEAIPFGFLFLLIIAVEGMQR